MSRREVHRRRRFYPASIGRHWHTGDAIAVGPALAAPLAPEGGLSMNEKHIAMIVGQDVEDSEFSVPYERLSADGHVVTVIGAKAGERVQGKRGKLTIVTECAASAADPNDFDALVIPGGYSPDHLRLDAGAVTFVKRFCASGKPVAAICHGPQLLIEAGVVRGRTLTSWPSVRTDLENAGAGWVDRPIVVDGNLMTSRKPEDLDAFCEAIFAALEGDRPRHDRVDNEEVEGDDEDEGIQDLEYDDLAQADADDELDEFEDEDESADTTETGRHRCARVWSTERATSLGKSFPPLRGKVALHHKVGKRLEPACPQAGSQNGRQTSAPAWGHAGSRSVVYR
jgi:protease I